MQTRRQLLQTAAAATSTLTFSGVTSTAAQTAAPSNRGRIFKAVKTRGDITVEKIAELKALGFDGIEGQSPGVEDPETYLATLKEGGLPFHGLVDQVHWKERLSSPDAAVRETGRLALEQAIRDSRTFGGSSVLLVPGKVTGENETHEHVWKRSIEEIRKVLPVASYEGIQILIETVWNGFCYDPIQLRDYIDEIASPWVKVYLDFGNMQKYAPPADWIRTLGDRIVKLDVKDWGEKNGFCPLGEGDVDWRALREALAEIEFTGWATREGKDESIAKTADLMDELLAL